jgi:PAS domain S-box-containing protein
VEVDPDTGRAMRTMQREFSVKVGLGALAALLLFTGGEYWYLRGHVIAEGEARLRLVRTQAEAVHGYSREVLRPAVRAVAPPERFVPEAMSGVYVTGRVMERFLQKNPEYYYKLAALEPRNPENRADEFEAGMIRRFAADPALREWQGLVTRNGTEQLVSLSPFVVEGGCLACHGEPELAPRDLLERYGGERGFHLRSGEVAGVRSIAIPMSVPLREVRSMLLANLLLALLATAVLVAATAASFRRLVTRPLERLGAFADAVGRGGETPPLPAGDDETGRLGRALERMHAEVSGKTGDLERRNEELTAVQEQLRRAHGYLESLFRTFPEGILVLEADYRISDLNPAAASLFGVAREDAVGKKCYELCYGWKEAQGDPRLVCPLEAVAAGGVPGRAVHRLPGERHIEVIATRLPAAAGEPVRVLEVLRDVTLSVRSREIVQEKSAELEAFIFALGHDLKAPLANVKGFVELLEEGNLPPEQARHFLTRVRYNVDVMARLISDLLELSRIGIRQEPAEEVEVREVVEEALQLHEGKIAARGATVSVAAGLPRVRYPRTRLLQVFANLVGNALDHGGDREGLAVAISCTPGEGLHTFVVADNGIGIEPGERRRVFEPFQSRTKKSAGSSGLGLTIVKRIVEKNGGTIRLESAPAGGAAFIFTIPA